MSARRQAVAERERDVFLAAGAGAGKTRVLVERYCDLVCGPDAAGVDDVLAFTFGDRAAGELKRRIRDELRERAERELDASRRHELAELAREAESAWISTIHAFCRRVIASHPLAAGADPQFGVLDQDASGRIASSAFDAAFAARAVTSGDELFELAAAYGPAGLRDLVIAAHDELRSRGAEAPELPEAPPPALDDARRTVRAAAERALAETEGARGGNAADQRARIEEALRCCDGEGICADDVEGWLVGSKAQAFAGESVAAYRDACATLRRALLEIEHAGWYEELRALIAAHRDEYRRRKEERSALDFEDLQLGALAVMRDNDSIGARYRGRFSHVLVDEFQDTNRVQLDLIRFLTGREEGSGRLFTVGDELQSIYRFRHADVEVFRRARAEAEADPAQVVLDLEANFRSRPEVLATVNAIGRSLFVDRPPALAMGAGHPSLRGDGPAVEALVVERAKGRGQLSDAEARSLKISRDEQAQPWRLAEARLLARRLAELAQAGYPRGDMVVLLRAFGHVDAYEAALADAGLRPYVVGGRGYWSRQQVADLRRLLACVANPLDDFALMSALAAPTCGVLPDTLWLLGRAAGGGRVWHVLRELGRPGGGGGDAAEWRERVAACREALPAQELAAIGELVESLGELRALAGRIPLEALVERAMTVTGYDLALLARDGGRRRMANARKLMRLAREFEAEEGRDLRAFVNSIEEEAATASKEAEAPLDVEEHDGVRVMTVHTAKGLEFPLVAVADLGRRLQASWPAGLLLGPGADGGADRLGLHLARLGRKREKIYDYAALQEDAAELERAEERRILHVAMTRAQERLILSGAVDTTKLDSPKDTEEPMATILRALGWSPGGDRVTVPPPPAAAELGATSAGGEVNVPVTLATPAELADELVEAPPEPERPPVGPLPDPVLAPPAPEPGGAPARLSYSALALYSRCGYRFYAERVLGMLPPARGASTAAGAEGGEADDGAAGVAPAPYARGIAVHGLLERSARAGFEAPDEGAIASALAAAGADADERSVSAVGGLVGAFLVSRLRAELQDARRLVPEAPFAFRLGETTVRGELDLLAELDDELVVVDYKSDALDGAPPAESMDRYDVQRRIYALAALRRFGRPVRVAYVFLERAEEPVVECYGPADAADLTAGLEALVSDIAKERFAVTDSPHLALCHDCPARARLCSYPPERTLAA